MYTYLVLMLPSLAGFSVFRLAIFYGEIYCFLTQLQEGIEVSKLVRTILKRLFATALYFYMKQANTLPRVSVQGVKSLGGHFACLCRGFEFYEVKKN